MTVPIPDRGDLGPAMKALSTDRQRAFVIAMVYQGGKNASRAYKEAGYSGNDDVCKVEAHRLMHDGRVRDAIRETSYGMMGGAAMMATAFIIDMIEDENVSRRDKFKAAQMILNRTGLHETTEQRITVKKEDNEHEKIEKAVALAQKLGIDPRELLGQAGIAYDRGEPTDVEAELVGSNEGIEDLL